MRTLYYDPVRDPAAEREGMAEYRERDDVLREADFVSIHVFLDESTRHKIGAREFNLMKPSAYLINTSGAGARSSGAHRSSQQGTIAGAALDVFETSR